MASQMSPLADRRHLGAGLGADPHHRFAGRCDDVAGDRQPTGLDAVDLGHRERHVLGARGARVLDDLAGSCSSPGPRSGARAGISGTRSVIFSIRLRVTWMCMPSIIGAVAPGMTWSLCSSGAPTAASRSADFGRGQVHGADHAGVVELDRLGADDRQGHPGQRNTAAARGRGGRRVGHRQLGQRLVDGGCRRPHLLGCSGRPARSAAAGCAAARCWRRRGPAHRRPGTGRPAR